MTTDYFLDIPFPSGAILAVRCFDSRADAWALFRTIHERPGVDVMYLVDRGEYGHSWVDGRAAKPGERPGETAVIHVDRDGHRVESTPYNVTRTPAGPGGYRISDSGVIVAYLDTSDEVDEWISDIHPAYRHHYVVDRLG